MKCLIAFLFSLSCQASTWYVSPYALNGDGTFANPWSLSQSLTNSSVVSGDTVLIQSGTYQGHLVSRITSANQPIIVRAEGQVVIDGNGSASPVLDIEGSRVWYWGLEIVNSDTNRIAVRGGGVSFNPSLGGSGNKLINCVVHDTGNAVFVSSQSTNAEVSGCVIYNNGWQGLPPDRGHGHGIYAQNYPGTNRMLLMNNVVFHQFGYGLHLYGQAGYVSDIDAVGNVAFENGFIANPPETNPHLLIQSGHGSSGNRAIGNIFYGGGQYSVNVGNQSSEISVTLQSNVFANSGATLFSVATATITDNIVRGLLSWYHPELAIGFVWDRNHYYEPSQYATCVDGNCLTWTQWRTAYPDLDQSSDFHGSMTNQTIYVRQNHYDERRFDVVVINPSGQDNATVSMSGLIQTGDEYEVRNACNILGPIIKSGVCRQLEIALPMTNLITAIPVGMSSVLERGKYFNVFVLNTKPSYTVPHKPGKMTGLSTQ